MQGTADEPKKELCPPRLIRFRSIVNFLDTYVGLTTKENRAGLVQRRTALIAKFRRKCVWRNCPEPDELFDLYRLLLPMVRQRVRRPGLA